jgi:hypothetical protein
MALALFIVTLLIGNGFIAPGRAITRHMLGFDFTAFYAAGTFTRQHRFDALYDLSAIAAEEHQIGREADLELSTSFGPYWNPPVFAWVFAPLSALPFHSALNLWLLANALALAAALGLLTRMLPRSAPAGHKGLLVLLVLICMPTIQALSHAQNTCISLLIVTAVVSLWRRDEALPASANPQAFRRACLAGALAGLLSYKPQLAAVVGAVLILDLGLPALLGMAATGALLLAITLWSMPGLLLTYLHRLPQILHYMQVEHEYLWDRHVTLKAFWRLLFQGRSAGTDALPVQLLTALTTLAVAALLLAALWRGRAGLRLLPLSWRGSAGHPIASQPDPRITRDRLIAATITAMPLLMPFYFDYDLLLLAVPATLFARDRLLSDAPPTPADRWLTRTWIALYAWLLVNPGLARLTHFNLTVPLLTATALLLIRRATPAPLLHPPATDPAPECLAAA